MAYRNNNDDEPLWLTHMRSNADAFSNWLEFLTLSERDIMIDIRAAITKDNITAAKICEGELQAIDKLRSLSTIVSKEANDYAEFERLRNGVSK